MKKSAVVLFLFLQGMLCNLCDAQDMADGRGIAEVSALFRDSFPLPLKLKFATRNVKKHTNDSTYMASLLFYKNNEVAWDSIKIKLRARGRFRRENCYYVPLKFKLNKAGVQGTLFEGNRKLKIVLPCLQTKHKNDLVLKEFLAYKLFELISPYHFKTRLVNMEFEEEKGSRIRKHLLKAILVEDIDRVAQRHGGREVKRNVHPMQQDDLAALQNSFFQYLIGNTDFSTRGRHNEKLLYTENKYVSVPYDFDMSGLVDASYATISGMDNMERSITHVTQRVYKGYKRDARLVQKVRQDFIAHKDEIFRVIDSLEEFFGNQRQFITAKDFIADFYNTMEDDKKFRKRIIEGTRTY